MTFKSRLATAAIAALGFATLASGSARADIITALRSTAQNGDGTYSYTYGVTLTPGSQLIGTATTDANGAAAVAQFGTVYDFGPVVRDVNGAIIISATGQMNAFNYTFNNTDPTVSTVIADDPTLGNIRFTYLPTNTLEYVEGDTFTQPQNTAAVLMLANDVDNLGTFTIGSIYAPSTTPNVNYDGQSYKSTNNTLQTNTGFTSSPIVTPAVNVPEPASLALLGAGLLGLGLARRRNAA